MAAIGVVQAARDELSGNALRARSRLDMGKVANISPDISSAGAGRQKAKLPPPAGPKTSHTKIFIRGGDGGKFWLMFSHLRY
jgi:hypothetical protein